MSTAVMKTYPLRAMGIDQALQKQFELVEAATREFYGKELLTLGDLGVTHEYGGPVTTRKVERVLARFFNAEAAVLLPGAGTGAIRSALSLLGAGANLLVHRAPVYPTTAISLRTQGIQLVEADYNDPSEVIKSLVSGGVKGMFIQHTRQLPGDRYDLAELIRLARHSAGEDFPIIVDDNYAVLKSERCGIECGATMSCFSCFKLLGPPGVGCVLGDGVMVDRLRRECYSGGMQIQGNEALEALRGMIYAPVALAVSGKVADEVCRRLNAGELPGVQEACVANAQSRVVLVKLAAANAPQVILEAEKLGAAPYPVGAESKYEIAPLFYRPSATFREADTLAEQTIIRINPMRAGADTVVRILREAIEQAG